MARTSTIASRCSTPRSCASRCLYQTNLQGSVVALSNQAGNVVDTYGYTAFGESSNVLTGNAFRYTGRRIDPETGLYYYRARYYSPKLGRFLQTNPVGTKDDLNLYTYVGDDPLDRTDPSGNCPSCLVGAFVEVLFEAYTGELNKGFSQAFEGNFGALGARRRLGLLLRQVALVLWWPQSLCPRLGMHMKRPRLAEPRL